MSRLLLGKTKSQSLIDWLDRCPPFVIYYLRRPGKAGCARLPNRLVCGAANMSERKFVRISQKISWKDVEAGDIDAFCRACGFSLFNLRERRYFLKQSVKSGTFMKNVRPTMRERFFQLWKVWKAVKASEEQ